MKVLHPRWPLNALRELRCKEWWYTGAHDPATGTYVSWYFVRVNVLDKLVFTVFDPRADPRRLPHLSASCRLRQEDGEGLQLVGSGGGLRASYRLGADGAWRFQLEGRGFGADVRIEPRLPPFTKFDNEMADYYGLIHYFHSRATGTVTVPGGARYALDGALTYQDHCWGRVPSRTGWHWIAVQNERVALASLVNYGAYAQRYTEVWLDPGVRSPRSGGWVRLDQNVSFEHEQSGPVERGTWRVTSPDLELSVAPRLVAHELTKVPPLLGFLVDVDHDEALVEASGRVRIDGTWVETGPMFGVMEEHHGRW